MQLAAGKCVCNLGTLLHHWSHPARIETTRAVTVSANTTGFDVERCSAHSCPSKSHYNTWKLSVKHAVTRNPKPKMGQSRQQRASSGGRNSTYDVKTGLPTYFDSFSGVMRKRSVSFTASFVVPVVGSPASWVSVA